MEARVIWSKLLELSSSEKLWNAQVYLVDMSLKSSSQEDEAEDGEEFSIEADSQIYQLQQDALDVGQFLSQSLKDKIAAVSLRDLRAYDYLADGKTSVMFIDLEEHNEIFNDLIKRIKRNDYEITKDIDEARKGSFYLVEHDFELDGQKLFCIHGRKIFPRRLAKRIKEDHFPTVGVYFEEGKLKAAKKSYFEFDEDIDFLLVDTKLFIFNKFYFEQATRFTSKMYEQTDEAFREIADAIFSESEGMLIDMLTENPKKLRRKLTKLKKNDEALYKTSAFMERFAQANEEEAWGYVFERSQEEGLKLRFPYTDENKIDSLFNILDDGRLYSKLTGRSYEVQQKREIGREEQ